MPREKGHLNISSKVFLFKFNIKYLIKQYLPTHLGKFFG